VASETLCPLLHSLPPAGEHPRRSTSALGRLLERKRPVLDLARSFVRRDYNTSGGSLSVEELQPGGDGAVAEEAFAAAQQDGKNPELVLIDEVML